MDEPLRGADSDVLRQAAEWFAVLQADVVDQEARARWQAWVAAHPAHAQAWQRVEALSRRFGGLSETVDKRAASQTLAQLGRRRHALKLIAGLGVGGASAWLAWREQPWEAWTADYRTQVGEQQQASLPDGTKFWLNTDSALAVAFDGATRRLRLIRGEVLIETAPDRQAVPRPFEVEMAEGRVRPLGTRFNLLRDGQGCEVSVFAGAVELCPARLASTQIVPAGQQQRFTAEHFEAGHAFDAPRDAWTRGILIADGLRLADLVAALSRYQRGYIECAPEVADLRLVGAYPLADLSRIYLALEQSLPVRVSRPLPWWIRVEAAA